MLINSGLALGALLSLTSLALFKETSGWYIILIALLFAVEIFARPLAWLEVAVEALLSISLYLILDDFNVTQIGHFLFGASLIWLGGDLIFGQLIQGKRITSNRSLSRLVIFWSLSGTFVLWDGIKPGCADDLSFLICHILCTLCVPEKGAALRLSRHGLPALWQSSNSAMS